MSRGRVAAAEYGVIVPLRVARPGWDTARAKWGEDVLRKIVLTGLAKTTSLMPPLLMRNALRIRKPAQHSRTPKPTPSNVPQRRMGSGIRKPVWSRTRPFHRSSHMPYVPPKHCCHCGTLLEAITGKPGQRYYRAETPLRRRHIATKPKTA